MSILITGGAGFIGSCLLRTLNDIGERDVIVVDNISESEKWKNLMGKGYLEYIHKSLLSERLPSLADVSLVLHMGACSATTETDFDYLYANNFEYSKMLWWYCAEQDIPFIYASSAATYGVASNCDDNADIEALCPLNRYGYSKQLFDIWAARQTVRPKQCVGLKFFNVFGPNEYHKGSMASVAYHGFKQIQESGKLRLFKSCHPDFADGAQRRDFVYVKDVCKVVMHFIGNSEISGLFNVGTGMAETFGSLGKALFVALGKPEQIEYIDMPGHLVGSYQYKTEASLSKLRSVGYSDNFCTLEDAVCDYVTAHMLNDYEIY